ncbi:MAG: fumarylacetoacetate hydrolase family protein [Candidatus Omnitrophica bacterium]|nr:fumarylacetoacetate hydrolase family protein [Candidatus Omnitrophota bacterium]
MKIPLLDLPEKIILVGLNYKDHAKEMKMKIPAEPIIFLKPTSALIKNGDKIIYPEGIKRLDYEAELAVVIKKQAKNIPVEAAKDYILGYTCLNDITARDLQKKDGQWTRAKSFDSFCPVGPHIETDLDPHAINIQSYLNGELKQDSNTSNFIFSVDFLISFISKIMTLKPADIISTGTPAGIGPMQKGDQVEVVIEGIGTLKNRVV